MARKFLPLFRQVAQSLLFLSFVKFFAKTKVRRREKIFAYMSLCHFLPGNVTSGIKRFFKEEKKCTNEIDASPSLPTKMFFNKNIVHFAPLFNCKHYFN